MRLDERTKRCLRIAFHIYQAGKDGSFWIDLAEKAWDDANAGTPPDAEAWVEVLSLLACEFPNLSVRVYRRLRRVSQIGFL